MISIDLPPLSFAAIMIDPPWTFKTHSVKGQGRSPSRHYRTMTLAEIRALPVSHLAQRDCAGFLWTVDHLLPQSIDILQGWGFTYRTVAFRWLKLRKGITDRIFMSERDLHMGTGYWTRANSEICLLGTIGRPKRIGRGVRRDIVAPVRQHLRKPDEIYERIEALVGGPYAEIFSRTDRKGWASWGDERSKFGVAA
jgi:N6-adenosine-specific RNA methylase IME4